MIASFADITGEQYSLAGGKGGTLARLYQAQYPVPNGFVIFPSAFNQTGLWEEVMTAVSHLRAGQNNLALAVRSSALSEDSAQASFAGEFESVLNVKSESEIRQAIETVTQSAHSERVRAYSQAQAIAEEHQLAVVVQKMIPAQFAGVLFTADPVSGSRNVQTGNYVHGLGEKLVSGEVNPYTFSLSRPGGKYSGPAELKPYARKLFKLAEQLEDDLSGPQDIEWAVADGNVYLLQARPITTLQSHNPATGEWNDSLSGDYLWTNANFGEAVPDVMTPATWSMLQIYARQTFPVPLPGNPPFMGNIGGRFYMNISLFASIFKTLGFGRERMARESEEFFGNLPANIDIPTLPFSRLKLLMSLIPFGIKAKWRVTRDRKELADFITAVPECCQTIRQQIESASSATALALVWQDELAPFYRRTCQMLQAGTGQFEDQARKLRHQLRSEVGEADSNTLLSAFSAGEAQLASLGPVVGLAKVAQEEMSREDYLKQYGHRGPHEFELSIPRPAEDPAWLETQLESVKGSDVQALLTGQKAAHTAALKRYQSRFPRKAKQIQRELDLLGQYVRNREAIRAEMVRIVWLIRDFALRAGALTGLGEDIFFLSLPEMIDLLKGEENAVSFIPARRQTHARYSALPPYPALIKGRFDPFAWANDPNRRSDLYTASATSPPSSEGAITGFAGAMGIVEGLVRRLDAPEDGEKLQPGEILVTATTNIGWTPLFPRAGAIVTDVGAPLSHAAIVARELGIPAVVGTGNATMRLHTGDRVRVDGGSGVVEILTEGV